MTQPPPVAGNLWIAKTLLELGGVEFGDFTLGRSTVHSPIYVNPRLLINSPEAMQRIAGILEEEVRTRMEKARAEIHPYDLVAGIPFGGLHFATAFSLRTGVPLIYPRFKGDGKTAKVEGKFKLGQMVLVIDDLMTTGGSIIETADILDDNGLIVKDAVVLIDRDQGGRERLKALGYNVRSLLNLRIMLTYYMSNRMISEEWYRKSLHYIDTHRAGG